MAEAKVACHGHVAKYTLQVPGDAENGLALICRVEICTKVGCHGELRPVSSHVPQQMQDRLPGGKPAGGLRQSWVRWIGFLVVEAGQQGESAGSSVQGRSDEVLDEERGTWPTTAKIWLVPGFPIAVH